MIVFLINRKKADFKDASIERSYLETERQANSTRKKSLEKSGSVCRTIYFSL